MPSILLLSSLRLRRKDSIPSWGLGTSTPDARGADDARLRRLLRLARRLRRFRLRLLVLPAIFYSGVRFKSSKIDSLLSPL
jgi:hypothetical protein